MRRIKHNDPKLKGLYIGNPCDYIVNSDCGLCLPRDSVDFVNLGEYVGKNTHVEMVRFDIVILATMAPDRHWLKKLPFLRAHTLKGQGATYWPHLKRIILGTSLWPVAI